jgi:hypothetical protein
MNRAPANSPSSEQAAKTGGGSKGSPSFSIDELIPANSPWRLGTYSPDRSDSQSAELREQPGDSDSKEPHGAN